MRICRPAILRFHVSIGLLALGLVAPADALADDSGKPPNIVLILADDVGDEALGCYGGQSFATPHLDALASSGTRFRHGYSMPVCHPTRVCLLTGRYPFHLGNPGWGRFPKDEEQRTVAHALKERGYATAVAGKWQLTLMKNDRDHCRRLGFDESCVFGWHEGPRYWQPMLYQNGKVRDDVADRYGPDVYVDFLTDFIERNRDRPFFAFYSMALCHDVTDDLKEPVPYGPGKNRYETYGEMAEAMDRCVGRLVSALDRMKLRENTLILFTGDNGTSASSIVRARDGKYLREPVYVETTEGRIRGGKGSLTDGGTRVPLLASWPGTTAAGKVVDDLVDMSDYYATLVDLAGGGPQRVRAPEDVEIDGQSFASRLRGQGPAPRDWAFAEGRGGKHWVRTQDYKLYNDGRFFHVADDAQEQRPIDAETPAARQAKAMLQEALEAVASP